MSPPNVFLLRPSMSQGTVMLQNRLQEKDFTVATPEEFVKRFSGTKVINKVRQNLKTKVDTILIV
jgi:hypothetical protein